MQANMIKDDVSLSTTATTSTTSISVKSNKSTWWPFGQRNCSECKLHRQNKKKTSTKQATKQMTKQKATKQNTKQTTKPNKATMPMKRVSYVDHCISNGSFRYFR